MVAICSNPACKCEFQDLRNARLFLLPPTHFCPNSMKLSDYCYWLCPECDATHTITRSGSEVVVGVRGPGTTYSIPAASGSRRRPAQGALRSYTEAG
jgi:hypothetical protein